MIAIQNFGMLWERDKVLWGSPGEKGSMLGLATISRRGPTIDFRDQSGIYVLYDEDRSPIWVGQAASIFTRLKQHKRDHLWNRWTYFTWFGFRKVNKDGSLGLNARLDWGIKGSALDARHEIEAVLIQVLEPRLNRRGPNWGETGEYLQLLSSAADDEDDEETEIE